MQKVKYKLLFSILIIITGCTLPYNKLKHSQTPYMTNCSYSLFKTVERLIRKKYATNNSVPYVVNGTMPANEFIDTSALYKQQLVSYSARIESAASDMIRIIFDYKPQRFEAYLPRPLLFPYTKDTEHTNAYYYIKFIPVDDFQKARPANVWDNSNLIAGVKFQDIMYLERAWMEKHGGFIDTNYPELYRNCFSALGDIYQFHLTNGHTIRCYMITTDMYDKDSPHYVRWKIKV